MRTKICRQTDRQTRNSKKIFLLSIILFKCPFQSKLLNVQTKYFYCLIIYRDDIDGANKRDIKIQRRYKNTKDKEFQRENWY